MSFTEEAADRASKRLAERLERLEAAERARRRTFASRLFLNGGSDTLRFAIDAEGGWHLYENRYGAPLTIDQLDAMIREFVGADPRGHRQSASATGSRAPAGADGRRRDVVAKLQALADDERAPEGERAAARAAIERLAGAA